MDRNFLRLRILALDVAAGCLMVQETPVFATRNNVSQDLQKPSFERKSMATECGGIR